MYKMVALYKVPQDKEAFDKHYSEVHTPLTLKIPGMKEFRVSKVFGSPTGKSEFYLQAEMIWEDKEAFNSAIRTPECMASGKDAMQFAGELVSVHFMQESVTKF